MTSPATQDAATAVAKPARDLKLIAFDAEDLAVLSAHVQDMEVNPADLAFLVADQAFALAGERFDWLSCGERCERVLAGLHFERVHRVRKRGLEGHRTLNLLSIVFDERDAPAGVATLAFSHGATIELEVECLEAQLRDIGPRRRVPCKPEHRHEDEAQGTA